MNIFSPSFSVLLATVILIYCHCGSLKNLTGKGDSTSSKTLDEISGVSIENIKALASQPMFLRIPGLCKEEVNKKHCRSWLGTNGTELALRVPARRANFSLENVKDDGSFQIAVYPNCLQKKLLEQESAANDVADDSDSITDSSSEDEGPGVDVSENTDETLAPGITAGTSRRTSKCRKLLSASADGSTPIQVVDESDPDVNSWRFTMDAEKTLRLVDSSSCSGTSCASLSIVDGKVVLGTNEGSGLLLGSVWDSIGGAVSDGFDYVESGISSALDLVGKTIEVDQLGGKKLLVELSRPGNKFYSAVKEDGPAVLNDVKGALKKGANYFAVYTLEGAELTADGLLEGAKYVGEYITDNLCMIGVATGLGAAAAAATADKEVALQAAALSVAESFGSMPFSMIIDGTDNEAAKTVNGAVKAAAKALSIPVAAFSGKYTTSVWEDFITILLAVGMEKAISKYTGKTGNYKQAVIMAWAVAKVSAAICYGLEVAPDPTASLTGLLQVKDISSSCLEKIRDKAIERAETKYENACYAISEQIKEEAAAASEESEIELVNILTTEDADDESEKCPVDPDDPAYVALLEEMGCQKKEVVVTVDDRLPELEIPDETVLALDNTWVGANSGSDRVSCEDGKVAVGFCSSGDSSSHCYGRAKEIICAGREGESLTDASETFDVLHDYDPRIEQCPENYVITKFCSSGGSKACSLNSSKDTNLAFRCTKLAEKFKIDYEHCVDKNVRDHKDTRIGATTPNHVMVGMCTSGSNHDCGEDGDKSKSGRFCPLALVSEDDSTPDVQLTTDEQWIGSDDDAGFVTCASGSVAVGLCSGGDAGEDCFGTKKEIICASPDRTILDSTNTKKLTANNTADITECADGYVITSFCSTKGEEGDCRFTSSGTKYIQAVQCTKLASGYEIDKDNCTTISSKKHKARLFSVKQDQVLIGMCSSGSKKTCGEDSVAQMAEFCSLKSSQ